MNVCWDEAGHTWWIWYSPGDIIFKPEHCLFLLEHYECLADGRYPPCPSSNYREVSYIRTIRPSWKHASNLKAEIDLRLSKVSRDSREALLHEVGCRIPMLSSPAMRALNYISGWRRKERPFYKWSYDYRQGVDNYPPPK